MTMMGTDTGTDDRRPRAQRVVRLDVAASMYDDLESMAVDMDESVNGVVYQAIRNHLDSHAGSSEGFISE